MHHGAKHQELGMRGEDEMLELLLSTAKEDERIRAVILNGSRVDPEARRDPFQDFDVVYLVSEVDSFRADPTWIDRFGERMILQMPEEMEEPPPTGDGSLVYLMQFADGNRIDLCLFPMSRIGELRRESLSRLLLDKDGVVEPFPPPSNADHLPTPPTAKAFSDCCNEFWWVCPYVAKGLWRREIVYAKYMLDRCVRDQLMRMLTWYVGMQSGFRASPGKFGKHLEQHLEPGLWRMLQATYSGPGYE
jgi:aminoglycoside 6-adenylyltransferase